MPDDPLRKLLADRALHTGRRLTLSSGKASTYYFDCKPVTLSADGAPLVGDAFVQALDALPASALPAQIRAIGGLTHGADPIVGATMLRAAAQGRPLDGFYVRKQPKTHGTMRLIENPPPPGTRVVIVEDVVTSGSSALKAVDEAQRAGCIVAGVIALVDRDEGGAEAIRRQVPGYVALYSRRDFPQIASAGAAPASPSEGGS